MATPEHPEIPVVFFGSGPVAAESLSRLARHFSIEAVITKPRPDHHKGPVPVLDLCGGPESPCERVITVSSKTELSEAVHAAGFQSRLGIVIDFGIIISQDVINSFELGILNSHFSLLPQWRGADPITFSILSGQQRTGVSLMSITAGLDEGPLITIQELPLTGTETTPALTAGLIQISDEMLERYIPYYLQHGKDILVPQESVATEHGYSAEPTFSRKLTKEDGILDFAKPAAQLEREVRAFIGWPGSRTRIVDRDIVVTAAHVLEDQDGEQGSLWRARETGQRPGKQFGFYTADGVLVIDRLKPAGKQEMSAEAFLAGYQI